MDSNSNIILSVEDGGNNEVDAYAQPFKGQKKHSKKIYGINVKTSERVDFDSIYQATIKFSGKNNNGLISKSLAHNRKNGSSVIAYGHIWYYNTEETIIKTPLQDTYQKIPLHLQKKRGRINCGLSKKTLAERGVYKCYVYNENFELVHKFHKISDCSSALDIPYSKIVKRSSKILDNNSNFPRFHNGLYFQQKELSEEITNYLLSKKKNKCKKENTHLKKSYN